MIGLAIMVVLIIILRKRLVAFVWHIIDDDGRPDVCDGWHTGESGHTGPNQWPS